jgi:hypothetical protein
MTSIRESLHIFPLYLIYLLSTSVHGEATLGLNFKLSLVDGHVRQNQANIFFPDEPILIEIVTKVIWIRYGKKLHVESQFNLCFHVRIVYFEKAVDELLQINIAIAIQI